MHDGGTTHVTQLLPQAPLPGTAALPAPPTRHGMLHGHPLPQRRPSGWALLPLLLFPVPPGQGASLHWDSGWPSLPIPRKGGLWNASAMAPWPGLAIDGQRWGPLPDQPAPEVATSKMAFAQVCPLAIQWEKATGYDVKVTRGLRG